MKLIKYLFRKFILLAYIIISAVISSVFGLVCGDGFNVLLKMFPIVLSLLLMLRVSDDIFDYEKDSANRKQYLSRTELAVFGCVIAIIFVVMNILYYGVIGIVSLVAVGYIGFMEKFPPLKIAYMALLFLFYFYVNDTALNFAKLAVIIGCLIVSAVYYIIKRKARK